LRDIGENERISYLCLTVRHLAVCVGSIELGFRAAIVAMTESHMGFLT
jgi:hypothetical protein